MNSVVIGVADRWLGYGPICIRHRSVAQVNSPVHAGWARDVLVVCRQTLFEAALIEITQYELGRIVTQSVKFLSHYKYAGRLYPRWLWGVCKQQSQTIENIREVDTVAVVKQSTDQCQGCRADHAQSHFCTNVHLHISRHPHLSPFRSHPCRGQAG